MSVSRYIRWVSVQGQWTRVSEMRIKNVEGIQDGIPDAVILMIPGNPGNEGFYAKFGELLLKALNEKVSHMNHVLPPSELGPSSSTSKKELFILEDQVKHKLEFCKKHLPRGKKVYILGHSIGAYMMLRILPDLLAEKFNIEAVYGLFPTVEYMAGSPNGQRLGYIFTFCDSNDWILKPMTFWIDYLPFAFKKWLCSWRLTYRAQHVDVPDCVIESAAELGNSLVLRNLNHMAHNELQTIFECDPSLLLHSEKIFFYYGTNDGWVPLSYAERMKTKLPKGHVFIDESDCEHAFVIKDGEIMAQVMAKFIHQGVLDLNKITEEIPAEIL